MEFVFILIALVIIALCVLFVFPIINNRYWNSMTVEQQCLWLTKKAKKYVEFKNLSFGAEGKLFYVVNKRKVLIYPWMLKDGNMLVTKENAFDFWSYPDRALTDEEIKKAKMDLEEFNEKSRVKLLYK